jgi:hypothetical protein
MRRVVTVVLVAMLTAVISGIDDPSWARQNENAQTRDAHRREIAARLAAIPLGSAIEVNPTRGNKFQALLEDVAADTITVRLATGDYSTSRTISIDEIKDLKKIVKISNHTTRNILIVVGIGTAVLVGTCAHALASADTPQGPPKVDSDGRP